MEKKGIEELKEFLGTFIDIGLLAYRSYSDDNKIDTGEGIKLALKTPSAWRAVRDIKEVFAEVKDLDPDELQELMQFMIEKFGE